MLGKVVCVCNPRAGEGEAQALVPLASANRQTPGQ